jgi:hypothetical protein
LKTAQLAVLKSRHFEWELNASDALISIQIGMSKQLRQDALFAPAASFSQLSAD